jgi:hypothetical protein
MRNCASGAGTTRVFRLAKESPMKLGAPLLFSVQPFIQ